MSPFKNPLLERIVFHNGHQNCTERASPQCEHEMVEMVPTAPDIALLEMQGVEGLNSDKG